MLCVRKWSFYLVFCLLLPFKAIGFSSFNYSTWNLEWLSSTPSSKFTASQRSDADYQALRHHFQRTESDIIAFQEVNDAEALRRVIGNDYRLFFSDRSHPDNRHRQFTDINQFTGIAVRHGISVSDKPDLKLDKESNSRLRFAAYVVVAPESNQPLHVLSVHLKARCSGAYKANAACRKLKQQGQALNRWIQQREVANQRYLILGDFNHNLSYPSDWLWQEITQGSSALLATKSTQAVCKVRSRKQPNKTHQFRSLIDHVITSHQLTTKNVSQVAYQTPDLFKYQLSDHCPIRFTL
ncbi:MULTISPECIES: endonuclease/exonuclease/phosphatase family protein [Vibrio]|uniref:endonuclease/exonuclease/phosphatase family protein n=1 Tax=Vibrio TaxID=662 RepID=UPI00056ED1BC|nr:endonuclease/exonuclease/phosphatase family protein [Vibrio pacinii]